jgi:hypothetical protein
MLPPLVIRAVAYPEPKTVVVLALQEHARLDCNGVPGTRALAYSAASGDGGKKVFNFGIRRAM